MLAVDSYTISELLKYVLVWFLSQILETEKELKCHQELLSNEKMKAEEQEEHLLKVQRRSEILQDSLTNKVGSLWFLSSYQKAALIECFNQWAKFLVKTNPI